MVLAGIEATEGVDPGLSPLTDAFLCSALDIKASPVLLERNNYRPSISNDQVGIGRIPVQLTFTHELKASGTFGLAPKIARLLRACGFQETNIPNTAAATIPTPAPGPANTGPAVAFAATTAPINVFDTYRLLITTGGVSGTAKGLLLSDGFPDGDATLVNSVDFTTSLETNLGTVAVNLTSIIAPVITIAGTWVAGEVLEMNVYGRLVRTQVQVGATTPAAIAAALSTAITAAFPGGIVTATPVVGVVTLALAGTAAPITLTTATVVSLGASGAQVTPTWAGSLVTGDFYDITLLRPGFRYDPITDNIPSLTFYVYLDGTVHKVFASRGTFKIDGKSAEYAKLAFTFTGKYANPIDGALPLNMVFEPSKPVKCEKMQFSFKGMPNVAGQNWSLDLAATVAQREDWNQDDGWAGVLITDRKPKLSADPESLAPTYYNQWKRMRNSDLVRVALRIGQAAGAGNLVRIQANAAQYDKNDYKDRTNIRTWDLELMLNAVSAIGNDEFFLHFA